LLCNLSSCRPGSADLRVFVFAFEGKDICAILCLNCCLADYWVTVITVAIRFRTGWAALSWSSPWISARSIHTGHGRHTEDSWRLGILCTFGAFLLRLWVFDLARLAETKLPTQTPKFYYGDISNETTNYIIITERVPFVGMGGRTKWNSEDSWCFSHNLKFCIFSLCFDHLQHGVGKRRTWSRTRQMKSLLCGLTHRPRKCDIPYIPYSSPHYPAMNYPKMVVSLEKWSSTINLISFPLFRQNHPVWD